MCVCACLHDRDFEMEKMMRMRAVLERFFLRNFISLRYGLTISSGATVARFRLFAGLEELAGTLTGAAVVSDGRRWLDSNAVRP